MEKRWKTSEFEKIIEEATVDCYNEWEEFSGMLYTLQDKMKFPFKATVLGETVKIVDIDDRKSSDKAGIIAKAVKNGKIYPVALLTIKLANKTSPNAKWLAVFRYWAGL